jgi:hypothetical protein
MPRLSAEECSTAAVHSPASAKSVKLSQITVPQLLGLTLHYALIACIIIDLHGCPSTHNPLVGGSNPSGQFMCIPVL